MNSQTQQLENGEIKEERESGEYEESEEYENEKFFERGSQNTNSYLGSLGTGTGHGNGTDQTDYQILPPYHLHSRYRERARVPYRDSYDGDRQRDRDSERDSYGDYYRNSRGDSSAARYGQRDRDRVDGAFSRERLDFSYRGRGRASTFRDSDARDRASSYLQEVPVSMYPRESEARRHFDRRDLPVHHLERRDPAHFERREPVHFERREPAHFDRRDPAAAHLDRRESASFDRRGPPVHQLDRRESESAHILERRESAHFDRRDPVRHFDRRDPPPAHQLDSRRDPHAHRRDPPAQLDRRDPHFERRESANFERRESANFDRRDLPPAHLDRRESANFDRRDPPAHQLDSRRNPHAHRRDPPAHLDRRESANGANRDMSEGMPQRRSSEQTHPQLYRQNSISQQSSKPSLQSTGHQSHQVKNNSSSSMPLKHSATTQPSLPQDTLTSNQSHNSNPPAPPILEPIDAELYRLKQEEARLRIELKRIEFDESRAARDVERFEALILQLIEFEDHFNDGEDLLCVELPLTTK